MIIHTPKLLAAILAGLMAIGLGACSKSPSSPLAQGRQFEVHGIVRNLPKDGEHSLTIEHEDIPGLMPSMTMPFEVREAKELESVSVGTAIAFKLIVTDKESWITAIRPIDAATVKLPAAAPKIPQGRIERLREGDRLPDFELIDQSGHPIRGTTFAGKSLLLTFIFTRCPIPNFCPLMAQNFHSLQQAIRANPELKGKVNLLSISFDEHDTPEILKQYGANLSDDLESWRFATGKPEEIQKLTRAFAVQVQPEAGSISHGLATALIGPDGVIRQIWRGNGWTTEEALKALQGL